MDSMEENSGNKVGTQTPYSYILTHRCRDDLDVEEDSLFSRVYHTKYSVYVLRLVLGFYHKPI